MPTPLTDADKVIRNDTGKAIAAALEALAAPEADKVAYDNTSSGLSADDVQDAIDELNTKSNTKMDKTNPTGTGSLSLNRKANTTVGNYSVAEGYQCEASGEDSHAEGRGTIANHSSQHVFGQYNVADTSTAAAILRGNYVEIVGNGTSDANRSNARTLDWNGNETLAGDLKINGNQSLSTLWTVLSGLTALSEKSGSIASFSTDIADKLFSCYVNVTAVQAGSGTPAPDNVRAISGWSACNLVECGKNLVLGTNQSFTASSNTTKTLVSDMWLGAGTYTLSFNVSATITSTRNRPLYFDLVNQQNVYSSVDYNTSGRQSWTFTLTEKKKVSFRWWIVDNNNAVDITNFQLEKAESPTTYQAYNGTTHNIAFNTTVYGGVLDVLSGLLKITHGYKLINDLPLSYVSSNDFFYVQLPEKAKNDNYLCECLNNIGLRNDTQMATANNNSIAYGGAEVKIKYTETTNVSELKTAIGSYKFVYELATPTTIQLTPTEVKTILGANNIFGDCGDIDLKYLETIGNRLT